MVEKKFEENAKNASSCLESESVSYIQKFTLRKRFFFLAGLALGALLMVWEDPESYCAAKQFLWTEKALMESDPFCASRVQASILPRRLTRGIDSLTNAISTTMPESLKKLNLTEVQKRVVKMRELVDFMPSIQFGTQERREVIPGQFLKEAGVSAKHPVFLVPGVITTGLELWKGEECAKKYFRQRVWGTFSSMEMFLMNPRCWLRHMTLDPKTGLDPEHIKLRAALGFEAADYVIGGYWVWAKLIENLAEIGYTPLNMELMGYDWRLSFKNLEVRDKFFTRLKAAIETSVTVNGEKAVIVAHSMGGNVIFYFLQWVEAAEGGNSPGWTDKHLEAVVHIAAPLLGIPSALTRILTGVIREFTELGTVISGLMEMHMDFKDRRQLMRSWGSIFSMLPKGGNEVWGYKDHFRPNSTKKSIDSPLRRNIGDTFAAFADRDGLTAGEMIDELLKRAAIDSHVQMYSEQHTFIHTDKDHESYTRWTNPLLSPLLHEKTKTFCLYGHGLDTERGYHYVRSQSHSSQKHDEQTCDVSAGDGQCSASAETGYSPHYSDSTQESDAPGALLERGEYIVDTSISEESENYFVRSGIRYVDGDGSVPLVSMGLMCAKGWRPGSKLNPRGSPVVTREYLHRPSVSITDPLSRTGKTSAEHVDIMGNHEMMRDVVLIAAGRSNEVPERIESSMKVMAESIDI